MRHFLPIFFLLFSSVAAQAELSAENKTKIITELNLLDGKLRTAQRSLLKAKNERTRLEQNLADTRAWGVEQQQRADTNQTEVDKLGAVNQDLVRKTGELKLAKDKLQEKYDKLRRHLCTALAGLAVAVYMSLLAPLVNKGAPMLGPWGFLVPVVAPVLVFSLAYLTIYNLL